MYKIELAKAVYKDLAKISAEIAEHIQLKVHNDLALDPKGSECKRLKGKKYTPYWRYRVRDYRVLYQAFEQEKIIFITRVKHRSDLY